MQTPRIPSSVSLRTASALWWQTGAAVASGILLILSFQPFNYNLLAWLALVPLLSVVSGQVGGRRAGGLGWLTGWIFFFFATNWITHSMIQYGGMPRLAAYTVAALFAAVLALFPAMFALITSHLSRAFDYRILLLTPFIWVATEWARGIVTGVTWNALGITQVDHIAIAWYARIGGVSLLSWSVLMTSAILVIWRRAIPQNRKFLIQAGTMILLALGVALLLWRLSNRATTGNRELTSYSAPAPVIRVAVMQPDVPLTIYNNPDEQPHHLADLLALTRRTLVSGSKDKLADLTVWAESPLVLNYENDQQARAQLDALVQESGSYLIFSAIARNGEQYYNSAQTIAPPAGKEPLTQLKRYDKMRLVPFGEYVPLRALLGAFVPAMVGEFTPGNEAVVNTLRVTPQEGLEFQLDDQGQLARVRTTTFVRTGTFVCYEAAYPQVVRRFVQNGATLLINISNDAWFGNTAGARQHLAHARMRAIENERDLVRVTNSGVSALISAEGKVLDELPMFSAQAKIWQAHINNHRTFYTHYGDWFAVVCTVISLLALTISFIRQRPNRNAEAAV